jgi:hypothetical protein
LNLPRGRNRGVDLARTADRIELSEVRTILRIDGRIVNGRAEIRMIKDVERFHPELNVDSFRDRNVFEQGQVKVSQGRTYQRIPSKVAATIRASDLAGRRQGERGCGRYYLLAAD